jgi:hypothetical protein
MKTAKQSKRNGGKRPKGAGRYESAARVSRSETRIVQAPEAGYERTGAFGSLRAPKLVGVSDEVRIANRNLARRARKAERNWLRSLPKGVKV